jgi:hypothetical protein
VGSSRPIQLFNYKQEYAMISFPFQGQVFELVEIRAVEDEDSGPFEEFVLRSHCADCGGSFIMSQRHGFRLPPNRRCRLHHQPGRKVRPKNVAKPKKSTPLKLFKPGTKARRSGIYLAHHHGGHLPNFHVMARAGEKFSALQGLWKEGALRAAHRHRRHAGSPGIRLIIKVQFLDQLRRSLS